jgi:hypothetical protein
MSKWNLALANRIKSLQGEHKSHNSACIIVTRDDGIKKILGNKATIGGVEYKVLPDDYYSRAKAKDKGALPCFNIDLTGPGKLEISTDYWKEPEKETRYSGPSESPASKKKAFAPVVEILGLSKAESEETLEALGNSKRLVPHKFGGNVRDSVFWRIMEIKAQEFNDPKKTDSISKEMFLKKHLHYLHGDGKRIFEMFAGKLTLPEIAKLPPEKVFNLLSAMEWGSYELSDPVKFAKGDPCDVLKWASLPKEMLKQLYQEEIRKRVPKKKPEKKPEGKKQAKAKTPAAKGTTPEKPVKKNKAAKAKK